MHFFLESQTKLFINDIHLLQDKKNKGVFNLGPYYK